MADDDAELVALIDNELDESRRTALLARLAADERLRQRYEEFRQTGAPLAASLDELLGQAPLARLRAALPAEEPPRQPSRRFSGIALRNLAAGVVIGLLAAGAAVWVALSLGLLRERQDWRTAVIDYTNMYSNETFTPLKPDAQLQAIELSALGARLGANLTPENVALPGLRFTTAFMLTYEGSPLGVIAYVDPSGAPVALCIIANDAPDAPMRSERRDNLSLAWWSRGGRSRLVIGRIPEERAVALAQTLEKRI
jgi:anti-sigma factor RsiW